MTRPKRTRRDGNHTEIVRELREAGFVVVETADLPGHPRHNPLDLFVARPERLCLLDVIVATNAEQIEQAASSGWVQVEIKPNVHARFTDNERAYLDLLGLWPPTFG